MNVSPYICIYDYYGLELLFSGDSGLPIVVIGKRGEFEDRIRLTFREGLLNQPEYIQGEHSLDPDDSQLFRLLVEKNSSEIIKKWLDVYLYNRPVETEKILYNIRESGNFGQ